MRADGNSRANDRAIKAIKAATKALEALAVETGSIRVRGPQMRQTAEALAYGAFLRQELVAAGLGGVRLRVDPSDGFLMAIGRYGAIEYFGPEAGPKAPRGVRLRVYTGSREIARRLRKLPGIHAQQIGDREARFWFKAGDADCLRAVAGVLRMRMRRQVNGPGASAEHMAAMRAARGAPTS